MQKSNIKVYLVDDHAMMLDGIRGILGGYDTIALLGSANNAKKAIEEIINTRPDLLITDYHMPEMSGLELIREVLKHLPELKIIVLSMHDEAGIIKGLLREGVAGYVLKTDTESELLEAIEAVVSGKIYLSSKVNRRILEIMKEDDDKPLLSPREHEILRLIANELSNKDIGERLFISERTVETHRKNIFRKTKTQTIVGLMKYAYSKGLI